MMQQPIDLDGSVVLRVEGGLGNQLFQYAAGIALADRLGAPLGVELQALEDNADRPYQLDLYNTRLQLLTADERARLPSPRPTRGRRFKAALRRVLGQVGKMEPFWSTSFAYDPAFHRIQGPTYLIGYWQSERYFRDHRETLRQDLRLRVPLSEDHPDMNSIRACNSVALHIRRGDYVTNAAAAQFHGLCDLDYYHRALQLICERVVDAEVFVFSDDLDWAREHLKSPLPLHFVEGHSAAQGHLDLELMRTCKHHVIANSSFSWWGAWLAETQGQIVCAPRRWFAASDVDTRDVVPERWIRL